MPMSSPLVTRLQRILAATSAKVNEEKRGETSPVTEEYQNMGKASSLGPPWEQHENMVNDSICVVCFLEDKSLQISTFRNMKASTEFQGYSYSTCWSHKLLMVILTKHYHIHIGTTVI